MIQATKNRSQRKKLQLSKTLLKVKIRRVVKVRSIGKEVLNCTILHSAKMEMTKKMLKMEIKRSSVRTETKIQSTDRKINKRRTKKGKEVTKIKILKKRKVKAEEKILGTRSMTMKCLEVQEA